MKRSLPIDLRHVDEVFWCKPWFIPLIIFYSFSCSSSRPAGELVLETRASSEWHATKTTSVASLCTAAIPSCSCRGNQTQSISNLSSCLCFKYIFSVYWSYFLNFLFFFTTYAKKGKSLNTKVEHQHFRCFCKFLFISWGGMKFFLYTCNAFNHWISLSCKIVFVSVCLTVCILVSESVIKKWKRQTSSMLKLRHSDTRPVWIDISVYWSIYFRSMFCAVDAEELKIWFYSTSFRFDRRQVQLP